MNPWPQIRAKGRSGAGSAAFTRPVRLAGVHRGCLRAAGRIPGARGLATLAGLEPATCPLGGDCSIRLSYRADGGICMGFAGRRNPPRPRRVLCANDPRSFRHRVQICAIPFAGDIVSGLVCPVGRAPAGRASARWPARGGAGGLRNRPPSSDRQWPAASCYGAPGHVRAHAQEARHCGRACLQPLRSCLPQKR